MRIAGVDVSSDFSLTGALKSVACTIPKFSNYCGPHFSAPRFISARNTRDHVHRKKNLDHTICGRATRCDRLQRMVQQWVAPPSAGGHSDYTSDFGLGKPKSLRVLCWFYALCDSSMTTDWLHVLSVGPSTPTITHLGSTTTDRFVSLIRLSPLRYSSLS